MADCPKCTNQAARDRRVFLDSAAIEIMARLVEGGDADPGELAEAAYTLAYALEAERQADIEECEALEDDPVALPPRPPNTEFRPTPCARFELRPDTHATLPSMRPCARCGAMWDAHGRVPR